MENLNLMVEMKGISTPASKEDTDAQNLSTDPQNSGGQATPDTAFDTGELFTMGVLLNKPFKMSWNIAPLTDKSRRTLHRLVSSLVSNTGVSESRWDARWLDEDNEWLILLDGEAAGVTLTKATLTNPTSDDYIEGASYAILLKPEVSSGKTAPFWAAGVFDSERQKFRLSFWGTENVFTVDQVIEAVLLELPKEAESA